MATRQFASWLFSRRKGLATQYMQIPSGNLEALITEYVTRLETSKTATDNCLCQWIIHPDDINKPRKEQRLRRGTADNFCPSHTREGLIYGFLRYAGK